VGVLAIVSNPPGVMSHEVERIEYRHAQDGEAYFHDFGPGVSLEAMKSGEVRIRKRGGGKVWDDFDGQRFLVNPPRRARPNRRRTMATKRRRDSKGRFLKGRARSTSRRRAAPKRRRRNTHNTVARSRPPQRRRASNPPRRRFTVKRVVGDLTKGVQDAALIIVGKAAARTIPAFLPQLPKAGPMGLAVQGVMAVVVGMIADQTLGRGTGRMVLAGGLTAPLETAAVAFNVPFLAAALSPVESANQVSAYVYGYVQPILPGVSDAPPVGGYVQPPGMGLGAYDAGQYDHTGEA